MNMLWIEGNYRKKRIGKKLVSFWETEMQKQGYDEVMTGSLSGKIRN